MYARGCRDRPSRGGRGGVRTPWGWLPVVGLASLLAWPAAGAVEEDALPWSAQPTARTLYPVRPQPMLVWQRAMIDAMAGPDASPLFRDAASALDVRWRLVAADQDVLPPTPEEADRALDLSLRGAGMGLERVLREALRRSEVLNVAEGVLRTTLRPAIVLERGPGGPRVRVDDHLWDARANLAAVTEGPRATGPRPPGLYRPPPRGPRPPRVRVGSGMRLVDDPRVDESRETALLASTRPAVSGWVGMEGLGLDALQAGVTWVDPWYDANSELVWWDLAARQPLAPRVFLRLELSSRDPSILPDRGRAGVSWQLPGYDTWRLSLDGTRRFPKPIDPEDPGEWRAELRLSTNLGWHVPVDIDRWPLGHQPGARGPVLPSVTPVGPNEVAPLARGDP